jgi:hypothetical protein
MFVVRGTKALVRSSRMNTVVYVVQATGVQYPMSTERVLY